MLDLSSPDGLSAVVDALAEKGWAVTRGLLPAETVARLREECLVAHRQGGFHVAGIGRGGDFTVREGIRSDEVMWLDASTATPTQRQYFERLDALQREINQGLYLGLFEFEGHFAIYDEGAYYKKHLDAFRGDKGRVVTVVYYLNPDWHLGDGGELRLYLDEKGETDFIDIEPTAGTAVIFLSERFWHEVLPSCKDRVSITGWYKVRPV
ncbi:2OG-Fe(II) oxygenase [Leeia oryzae]|uniref:2OG-Fe(II) oxygenase n=1 Tax=Leeia oryzae TaxID=356662 RepID=UPI00037AC225|nr:2OG-Fe(II) oxygenase [Leeia oryzae]